MALATCCLKSFAWEDTPTGQTSTLGPLNTYIAGTNTERAILFVHDALGWTFPNARLLADHYAREVDATVYLPDFFGGETLPFEPILAGRFHEVDFTGFLERNARPIREPEIFDAARALRQQYKKVGAIGFCYGGWACLRLGSKDHDPALVDAVSIGHPSLLTKEDIDEAAVPVQMLAPEHDVPYPHDMKVHTFEAVMKNGLPLDYVHFPGVEHGSLVRGDARVKGEREAMARAKDAAVNWFRQWLYE
ncbi:esterase/lipase [Cladophialophora yegresii CBS 114405]|uniref:Esterase/lipase n=1 Tax=Cladophialophora yegresii CBS 114405 TaxID=1182544 RepID=W9WB94_9EURO|nr:esterase/lipase [Cladophialophora yegresii CBS 114405]EXJ65347.1 esterase/lipase [Cladophialophora yegresii CBS 114405]